MAHHLFDADVARFKAAGLQAEYFWWPDETDEQFIELLKQKKQTPGSQHRTYMGLTTDGLVTMWHCLFSADGVYLFGFNNSFPCPPRCGGG